jgi:hypothetical protein
MQPVVSNVNGIVPCLAQQAGYRWRKRVVNQEFHVRRGTASSRSMADTAAKRRHSRMSSGSRSGYSARISCSLMPPANILSTVATGIRRPRTHGTPPIWLGFTVMRSKFVACISALSIFAISASASTAFPPFLPRQILTGHVGSRTEWVSGRSHRRKAPMRQSRLSRPGSSALLIARLFGGCLGASRRHHCTKAADCLAFSRA